MNNKEKLLILKIARNYEPQFVFDMLSHNKDCESCYKEIVQNQIDNGINKMHLPEPWNGHLSKAKVLFISSNPSLGTNEIFPTKDWTDKNIINFFDNRFVNADKKIPKFWQSISKYVLWLYPESKNLSPTERLDKYAVSTEIVHCKSLKEKGVKKCFVEEEKFVNEIVKIFKGDYIIILGKKAIKCTDKLKEIYKTAKIYTMPHPSAYGVKDDDRRVLLGLK